MSNVAGIRLSTDDKSWMINIPFPDDYQYQMDRSALMVHKNGEPQFGSVLGFYIYRQDSYDSIGPDNYSNNAVSEIQIENFNYRTENIYNYDFKTYCIRYKDDNTVNKVFIYKINDEIVGQVELQKLGATSPDQYTIDDISPFLGSLVNTDAELENGSSSSPSEIIDSGIDPNEVIDSITKIGGTSKFLLIMAGLFVIGGIILSFALGDIGPMVLIAFIPFAIMFVIMYLVKTVISKNNLKKIDLDALRDEIARGCQAYPSMKTYLTNNYLISNHYHAFVVRYEDIVWMYPFDKYANGVRVGQDLIVCLINKKKESLPFNDEIYGTLCNTCPDALLGFSFQNKKQYKQICKEHQNQNRS